MKIEERFLVIHEKELRRILVLACGYEQDYYARKYEEMRSKEPKEYEKTQEIASKNFNQFLELIHDLKEKGEIKVWDITLDL